VLQLLPMLDEAGTRALEPHVDLWTVSATDVDTICSEGQGAVALISRSGTTVVGGEILDRLPTLAVVSSTGSGADCFDVRAAADRGVPVLHNPGLAPGPVAEYVIGAIITAVRRLFENDRYLRSGGNWMQRLSQTPEAQAAGVPPRGREVSGLTLGIVGYGHIGRDVARRAQAGLDMDVVVYDPALSPEEVAATGVRAVDDLHELLAQSDVVTLHIPHLEATHHLIDANAFKAMRPSAFLINAARGGVVDEQALILALADGHLAGAAIDVFEAEPPAADNPLFELPNVMVTPHIAGTSAEGLERLSVGVADGILRALRGQKPERMVLDVWPPARLDPDSWPLA
jgi:phosphoglycerate dehydrogenase-like enzyme